MVLNASDALTTAVALRDAGRPARAATLDTLVTISAARLAAIIANRHLIEDDVRSAVERTGLHELVVTDVLRKFAQFDCADYRSQYEGLLAQCQAITGNASPSPPPGWRTGEDVKRFLLHDTVCQWSPRDALLTESLIEKERRYLLARCYLIRQQLAFPTTLDLLSTSYRHSWPNWQKLWTYF